MDSENPDWASEEKRRNFNKDRGKRWNLYHAVLVFVWRGSADPLTPSGLSLPELPSSITKVSWFLKNDCDVSELVIREFRSCVPRGCFWFSRIGN